MMIATIARQNLFHDKVRLTVTLTGVVFAVVLITVQVGLFIGFTTTISGVIDNAGADVWVASAGVKNFDIALPMHKRKLFQVRSVPGVEEASKFLVQFANWKRPDGGQESVEIVGYDPQSGMGAPWNVVRGGPKTLDIPDGIVLDRLYLDKLGVSAVGDTVEINNRRARVVGFSQGIRSFTTSPYVFANYRTALDISTLGRDELTYVLVRAAPGVSPEELRDRIRARVKDVDVFTTTEFSRLTQNYWMLSTGAGAALLVAAALGLVVGMVVVAQTLYATTMDHLPEFATMKAMGAPDSYIYKILVLQAVLSAVIGYCLGIGIGALISMASEYGATAIMLPPFLAAGMFFLTLFMCVTAAVVSINKVTRIDPLLVFKGR